MFSLDFKDITKANETILEKEGYPDTFALRDKSLLKGEIDKANFLLAKENLTIQDVLKAAGSLLYGIASVQAFRDGNRRTALLVSYNLLQQFGLESVMDIENGDDYQIMRMLNDLVDKRTKSEKDFVDLLVYRYLS